MNLFADILHFIRNEFIYYTLPLHLIWYFKCFFYAWQTFIVSKHAQRIFRIFFFPARACHTDRQSIFVCVREGEKYEFVPTSDDIRACVSPRHTNVFPLHLHRDALFISSSIHVTSSSPKMYHCFHVNITYTIKSYIYVRSESLCPSVG